MILVLCIILAALPLRTLSSSDIILIAINDTVPFAVNEATMPFYASNCLYIPYSVFNNETLGVVPSYDSASRTLTLSNQSAKLQFLLDEGIVRDDNGIESKYPVKIRLGIMFVPAEFCANYFGISLSYLNSADGYPVIRLKTGDEVYSDALFVEKAENLIAYRLSQYVPSDGSEAVPPSSDLPSGSHDSQEPSDIHSSTQPKDEPNAPDLKNRTCIFAICGATEAVLNRFDASTLQATFLFTPEQITAEPELIRHVVGCGYSFGLDLRNQITPLTAFEAANNMLLELGCCCTALVLCDAANQSELLEAGLAAFTPFEDNSDGSMTFLLLEPETAFSTLRSFSADNTQLLPLRETSVIASSE